MRILGPDGLPLGGSDDGDANVTPEVRQMVEQAKAAAAQGDLQNALQAMVMAFQSDVTSDLVVNTTIDLLGRMAQDRGDQEGVELQIFQQMRENRDNPEIYYFAGSRFLQAQQYFIARPFFARAKELVGENQEQLAQAIDVEYSQVLMELGRYQEGVDLLQDLNDAYGGLPLELILKMTECFALLRQLDEAEALYDVIPDEAVAANPGLEEWRDELGDMIARVHDFDDVETLELPQWHYVQTRSLILETNPDENMPGQRFVFFTPSEEDIAYIVALTAAMLDQKGYAPNRILWLGDSSEVLAHTFAQWWEVDDSQVREYQTGDNTDDEDNIALLVLAHSYDVSALPSEEALFELFPARAGLITFALDLHWTERQPITPDISGYMSQICHLPWEAKVEMNEEQVTVTPITEKPDARALAVALAAQFPEEAESDKFAQETLEEFAACTDLILDHRDGTLKRKSMVTHSPLPGPRFGY